MDKKVFLAVTLCAGIFLLWQNFYLKPYTERHQAWVQAQAQNKSAGEKPQSSPVTSAPAASKDSIGKPVAKAEGPKTITLGAEAYGVSIDTKGGVVSSVHLPEYRGQKTDKIEHLIGGPDQLELNSPSSTWSYLSSVIYSVQRRDKDAQGFERVVLAYEDASVLVQRSYTLNPASYYLDNDTSIQFKKEPPKFMYIGLKAIKTLPKSQLENERRQIILNRVGNQETYTVGDIDDVKENIGEGNWFGFSSRYFLNAIVNRSTETKPQFQARPTDTDKVAAGFFYKVGGNGIQMPVRMYYGPKDVDVLKTVGNHLDSAVDFGWFTVFAYPMLTALKWFYKYLHNFGLAIILLTVLVKLATYPLTLKSMKSMKQMQRIQPQIQRLRERHKDDKEKLNREMLQLMRANGYNPMSGCLPMFIQMPIFVALYNVLYWAIDLYGQPFFGWIHDLSAKDPLYVTPVLLALMMFVQQKMTPNTATDPAQQRMMMLMPVIFGFMMLWLPSGLTLYMLVNSVVSVVQQVVINKTMSTAGATPAAA